MLTIEHWTKVCGPQLIADWKSHYIHQIKWWPCSINMYYIIIGTFCKWSHASVYTHTITCDGRQDRDYHYPVYHDFGSTCFNPICCHYFQVLTLLKACAGISHSVDCALWYIVFSESRCALIKDVGSDVHKHPYRPEPI